MKITQKEFNELQSYINDLCEITTDDGIVANETLIHLNNALMKLWNRPDENYNYSDEDNFTINNMMSLLEKYNVVVRGGDDNYNFNTYWLREEIYNARSFSSINNDCLEKFEIYLVNHVFPREGHVYGIEKVVNDQPCFYPVNKEIAHAIYVDLSKYLKENFIIKKPQAMQY